MFHFVCLITCLFERIKAELKAIVTKNLVLNADSAAGCVVFLDDIGGGTYTALHGDTHSLD